MPEAEPMENAEFWGIIDLALWAPDFNTDVSKRELKLRLPALAHLKQFRDKFTKLYNSLYNTVIKHEQATETSCGVGDDGFSDLLHHIIGLGKEEYEKAMKKPSLVIERTQRDDYTESFAYAIPYDDDYKDPTNLDRTQSHIDRLGKTVEEEVERELSKITLALHKSVPHNARFYGAIARHLKWAADRVVRRFSDEAERMEEEDRGEEGC